MTDLSVLVRYRPTNFGDPFLEYWHEAQYGPSPWSVHERQLFAAIISKSNRCRFCTALHARAATRGVPTEVVAEAVAQAGHSASLSPAFRAAARFAVKLTQEPAAVTRDDIRELEEAGVDRGRALSVVHLCSVYAIMNRLADSVDFAVPEAQGPELRWTT